MWRNPRFIQIARDLWKNDIQILPEKFSCCKTINELETLYEMFKACFWSQWKEARITLRTPKRYEPLWFRKLEIQSRERSKTYRKAKKTRLRSDCKKFKTLDKRTRDLVKEEKRSKARRMTEKLRRETSSTVVIRATTILQHNGEGKPTDKACRRAFILQMVALRA